MTHDVCSFSGLKGLGPLASCFLRLVFFVRPLVSSLLIGRLFLMDPPALEANTKLPGYRGISRLEVSFHDGSSPARSCVRLPVAFGFMDLSFCTCGISCVLCRALSPILVCS